MKYYNTVYFFFEISNYIRLNPECISHCYIQRTEFVEGVIGQLGIRTEEFRRSRVERMSVKYVYLCRGTARLEEVET